MKSNEETSAGSALRDETLKGIARWEIQARGCTCPDCLVIREIVQKLSPADDLKKRKFAIEILLEEAGLPANVAFVESDKKAEKTAVSDEEGEENPYIVAARKRYADGSDNDIKIDSDAQVSYSDGGAFVRGWLWVPDEDLPAA
ncbi:MAG: hypothetical protein M0Z68_03585 [Gammaproteobacteria bacterium]|nr:hypothetical protein [Gammaproteobacteria bacterium]